VLRLEYRSKLLNPRWAEAMASQGSGGAFEISQRMTALLVRPLCGGAGWCRCLGPAGPPVPALAPAAARLQPLGLLRLRTSSRNSPLIRPPGLGRDHGLPGPVDVGPGIGDVRPRPRDGRQAARRQPPGVRKRAAPLPRGRGARDLAARRGRCGAAAAAVCRDGRRARGRQRAARRPRRLSHCAGAGARAFVLATASALPPPLLARAPQVAPVESAERHHSKPLLPTPVHRPRHGPRSPPRRRPPQSVVCARPRPAPALLQRTFCRAHPSPLGTAPPNAAVPGHSRSALVNCVCGRGRGHSLGAGRGCTCGGALAPARRSRSAPGPGPPASVPSAASIARNSV
jgi:hypothetical protein